MNAGRFLIAVKKHFQRSSTQSALWNDDHRAGLLRDEEARVTGMCQRYRLIEARDQRLESDVLRPGAYSQQQQDGQNAGHIAD